MILVDTSVWVEALRKGESPEAKALRVLLDEDRVATASPVRVEILSGASIRSLGRLRRLLSALPNWAPTTATWQSLETWVAQAVAAGQTFGVGDLLIAGIGAEHQAEIWSLDGAFPRMAKLGFIQLYVP